MRDDLGVRGSGEQLPVPLQVGAYLKSVGEIAVVSDSKRAEGVLHQKRLGIFKTALPGGGVPVVSEGVNAVQPRQPLGVEDPFD